MNRNEPFGHVAPASRKWRRRSFFVGSLVSILVMLVLTMTGTARAGGKGSTPEAGARQLAPFGHIDKATYLRKRAEYIAILRGWERGKPFDSSLRPKALNRMKAQRRRLFPASAVNPASVSDGQTALVSNPPAWMPIGPDPIPNGQTEAGVANPVSGRVTAIAVHPDNPDIAYVGTASGGVYRTLDGGTTWMAIFDSAQSLAIGAVTIDPVNPSTVFVGTGEGNSPDMPGCFFGVGLYRIDNADTSPLLNGPFDTRVAGTGTSASNGHAFLGTSITRIVVDPNNDNRIFVGNTMGGFITEGIMRPGNTNPPSAWIGLYFSSNALSSSPTFSRVDIPGFNGWQGITDIVYAPGGSDNMIIGVWDFSNSGLSGIYQTINASAASSGLSGIAPTFAEMTKSDPVNIKLAANLQGSTMTLLAATGEGSCSVTESTSCLGDSDCPAGQMCIGGKLFLTTNKSSGWKYLSSADGFCGKQCTYDIAVAIDPGNPNIIYLAGQDDSNTGTAFAKSTDGGATFFRSSKGLHADAHAITIAPSNPAIIYTGDDGGIFRSTDYGTRWTSINNAGFSATQFQSLALHPTDHDFSLAGAQDNGTDWYKPDGTWLQVNQGDGGYCAIDQNAANTTDVTMYSTHFNMSNVLISFQRIDKVADAVKQDWTSYGCHTDNNNNCTCNNGLSCSDSVSFYAPLALGPGSPNAFYFGTDRLYRSNNKGVTMTVASQVPLFPGNDDNAVISSIGISPKDDNVRIVGLENGAILYTTTGSSTLTSLDPVGAGSIIPDQYITRTIIDPGSKYTAYMTLGGYFGGTAVAQSHVWKVTNLNGTPSITAINGTAPNNLPDVPVVAFAVDDNDSAHPGTSVLYAGTDIGVYQSVDNGTNWTPFGTGLPHVPVFDMGIQNTSRMLRIATYGRGLWQIALSSAYGTVPGAPQAVLAAAGNSEAFVAFQPPASNGGSAITSYTVTSSPGNISATGTSSPITVTGLTNGTTYTFTVTAANAAGTGPASAPSNAVTPEGVSVIGHVRKPSGKPIPNVTVNITGSVSESVMTNVNGKFIVTGLSQGTVTITPVMAGFSFQPSNITVTVGDLNLRGQNFIGKRLSPAPVGGSVEVMNGSTSALITQLYLSPSSSSTWGANQLTSSIPAGGSMTITGVSPDTYDLKAVFSDGSTYTTSGFSVTAGATTTITATPSVSATGSVKVINGLTSASITQLYLSPSSSSTWGANQLTSSIPAGGSMTITGVPPDTYDLKVVFSGGGIYTDFNFGVTAGSMTTITAYPNQ